MNAPCEVLVFEITRSNAIRHIGAFFLALSCVWQEGGGVLVLIPGSAQLGHLGGSRAGLGFSNKNAVPHVAGCME